MSAAQTFKQKIKELIKEGFIVFTFSNIKTELNKQGEEKKKPLGMPAWKNINKENFKEFINLNDKAAGLITGAISNITVLDFDIREEYDNLLLSHPDLKNYRTIKTNKGVHIYFAYDANIKDTVNGLINIKGVDIRNDNGIIFCPPTKYTLLNKSTVSYDDLGGEILPIPDYLFNEIKPTNFLNYVEKVEEKEIKTEKIKIKKSSGNSSKKDLEYIRKAIEDGYLDEKAKGSYDDWRDVGFIIKHTSNNDEGLEVFNLFSQINQSKYDPDYTKSFWKVKETLKKPLTIATLKKWVNDQKTGDVIFCKDDNEAGTILYEQIKNRLKYCNKTIYFKKSFYWVHDKTELDVFLIDYVMRSNIYRENEDKKLIPYAQNVSPAKNLIQKIKNLVMNNDDTDFYDKFFITTKEKLCFKNGVLNLSTKEFIKWEDMTESNEVFTTNYINKIYTPERDEELINKVKNDIFIKIFGADNYERALKFYSRAMGGNVQDKTWALFIGARNCGKGVLENYFKNTFESYISTVPSDVFLCKRVSNAERDKAWLMDLEFVRLTLPQEFKMDSGEKCDGVIIKNMISGGDMQKARKLYQDLREFKIQSSLCISANDMPEIKPLDTMETCTTFYSNKQFKSIEFIEERRANNATEFEMSLYEVADPDIKSKCCNYEYNMALVHLILDFYTNKPVKIINKFVSDDSESNIAALILSKFEITKNEKDWVNNDDLGLFCAAHNISLTYKLKPLLKSWGCKDFKSGKRGLNFLKVIVEKVDDITENK